MDGNEIQIFYYFIEIYVVVRKYWFMANPFQIKSSFRGSFCTQDMWVSGFGRTGFILMIWLSSLVNWYYYYFAAQMNTKKFASHWWRIDRLKFNNQFIWSSQKESSLFEKNCPLWTGAPSPLHRPLIIGSNIRGSVGGIRKVIDKTLQIMKFVHVPYQLEFLHLQILTHRGCSTLLCRTTIPKQGY